ncbi:MAG TPA: tryptophan synthase subunit alpha [Candidatus Binataceae bacterium]|jgi:tryptophan synthase alpha chain|nr:tryptophan synthase subunit alpha [Candidatus Binataceae bacterium]
MAKDGRIAQKFKALRASGQAALIPFIVAGDPDLKHTGMLVMEMEARGADIIELGVPFSDPMADGPANQRALARGLASGATLSAILGLTGELRKETQIPIILFGYFNPFFRYGCERLCADAARSGVDGLLVVDMPPEESRELAKPARAAGIDLIYLLAPTTPIERSRAIARSASGFLYYVSVTGVTGARAQVGADVEQHVRELSAITRLPIGVGFGISTPAQAAQVAAYADAVVVGSALTLLIEANGKTDQLLPAVGGLVGAMKEAMRTARTAQTDAASA